MIDFRTATIPLTPTTREDKFALPVPELLPEPPTVPLVPLTYVRQPEHWGIEVVACPTTKASALADGPVVPPFRVYKASITFFGPLGTCGIEVIGATTRQAFDLAGPPGCDAIGDRG